MTDYDRLLPPLSSLVAFEAAHRLRNFTHAAEELHTSQATVSRRVRELEADLGVSLFDRHRYDLTPTRAAETLAASVRLSLGELASTAVRLRREATRTETLTVLVSLSLASAIVTPALADLQHDHPELSIRMVTACEPIESTTETFDVAVQYGPPRSQRFAVEFLTDEAVFPVCAPTVAAGLPAPLSTDDLRRVPLLHVTYDDPTWTTWPGFVAALGGDGSDVEGGLVFSSYHVCLDAAERGDGVALGWERSVGPRLEAGALVRLPGLCVPDAGRINGYLPKHDRTEHPHAAALLARIRARVSGDRPLR